MANTQAVTAVDIVECRLRFGRPLSAGEATQLRGHFGNAFADEVLLHHHNPDGSLRYAYPRVQFKVLDQTAHLIGLAEGCDLGARLWATVDQAQIGQECLPVLGPGLTRRRETVGESGAAITYGFRTPWLGLNQDNHRCYQVLRDPAKRQRLLERILVGNCLALANVFDHRVAARLTADQ